MRAHGAASAAGFEALRNSRMVWGSFLIVAAALKTPTRNGYNAQGVNLTFYFLLAGAAVGGGEGAFRGRVAPGQEGPAALRTGTVYVYTHTHTYIYICTHLSIYVYIYIYIYI